MNDAIPFVPRDPAPRPPEKRPAPRIVPGAVTGNIRRVNGADQVPLLTRYLRIFWRWKHVLAGVLFVALVLGVVATLLMTPLYTARATIEIAREADKVVQIQDVRSESSAADLEFYQTQYGLLRSRSLAEQVARQLKLADDPAFFAMFGKKLDGVAEGDTARLGPAGRDERVREAGKILLKNLDIAPVRLSRLVEIGFTSPSADLSARVANAWASHFIESNLERKFQATSYARKFLEGRLEQLRQRLEQTERQLVQYASQQQIINLPGTQGPGGVATGERSIMVDDLVSLNNELGVARAERIRAESRIGGGAGGTASEALASTTIGGLRQKRAEIAADYSRVLIQFTPDYPAARALASQVAQLDRSIATEERRVQSSLSVTLHDARSREQDLQGRVDTLKTGMLSLRQRSIQYNIYQREVDTNRQLYDALLQRYKEIGVSGGVGTNNVSIIDAAVLPDRPSRPRVMVNLAIALGLGLMLGAGLVFALEQIDETLTDPAEVERTLDVPLLGTIPKGRAGTPVELLQDRKSALVEAYLALQTNLEFSTDHGMPRLLSVTSTRPAEGKSTTSYAITLMLARAKRRTLLIDGDMRNPSVHNLLGLRNDRGFSNLLAGSDDVDGLVRNLPELGFDTILAGPIPPNAAELLTGGRLDAVLAMLLDRYDHVIIDSPPVMGLADAPLIASRVEGTVFVVEAHGIRARMVRLALDRLTNAQAHIFGAVLSKFQSRRAHFDYGYEYGYTYGRKDKRKGDRADA